MTDGKQLTKNIWVDGTLYEAGSTPPKDVAEQITNPKAWNDEEQKLVTSALDLPSVVAVEQAESAGDPSELKGKALDKALEDAGLEKSGTAAEKRARLAEHQAGNGS